MTNKVEFSAPSVIDGEIEEYRFNGEGPMVVAFFPGSFTPPCREEMCNFRDDMNEFNDLGAEVVAVSVDTPFAQKEFADQNDLNFRLVSDTAKEIVEQYGVKTVFPDTGHEIAERAVFLVSDGEVVYREVMDDPHNLPDMEELKEAIEGL
jgi:peroxiredoxin